MRHIVFTKIESLNILSEKHPNSILIPGYETAIMGATSSGEIVYHYIQMMRVFSIQKAGREQLEAMDKKSVQNIILEAIIEIAELEDYGQDIQNKPRPIICKDDVFLNYHFNHASEGDELDFWM